MEMCRACLATGKGMVEMDENFVHNYNILTSLNVSFSSWLLVLYLSEKGLERVVRFVLCLRVSK